MPVIWRRCSTRANSALGTQIVRLSILKRPLTSVIVLLSVGLASVIAMVLRLSRQAFNSFHDAVKASNTNVSSDSEILC